MKTKKKYIYFESVHNNKYVCYEVIYSWWSYLKRGAKKYRVRRQLCIGEWYPNYETACEAAKLVRQLDNHYNWHRGDRVYVRRMKEGA